MKGIPLDSQDTPSSTIRIAIRFPAQLKADFEEHCLDNGCGMSDLIRALVKREIDGDGAKRLAPSDDVGFVRFPNR